jgi:hypothetical protein
VGKTGVRIQESKAKSENEEHLPPGITSPPSAFYVPPTAECLLPIAHCLLLTADCLLGQYLSTVAGNMSER